LPWATPSLHPLRELHQWFTWSWGNYLCQMTCSKVGYKMAKSVLTGLWICSGSPEYCHRPCNSPLFARQLHPSKPKSAPDACFGRMVLV
jgi:hypothetical protein